ncbi:acyl carrier protein [Saccharothrix sp. BKS2]|uniref:Acyl carrier protein n=1 Tax=Saccharothrix lopnurensis TaxID=1670621 RepID=A0ABW1PGP5_9PSEU
MDPRFTALLTRFLPARGDRELTPESSLRDLGLDSMQSIELLFAIEDEFRVSLADDDLTDTTFATAGNLWRAVSAAARPEVGAV